ncbi:pilin N-terminal domain-containing protein [Finegoldia magna]|uniref:pilin N-terminal domain-containing protein n=1 Tax=Finegoldia magna TaxID=1260 RepID=UPI00290764DF|nr:pilin N-terminal domain-containing protein [Finegoldia magna]MDU5201127.1 pilin N-terminal domain-containing protein [Finegoldia magna]MDU6775727.1 pilin N-terminal domain-containing protein [Finegoldia magna]
MKKRFLSLIIALAMMVGVFTPLLSSAADEQGTTSVVVHKMLMTKAQLDAHDVNKEGYDGTQIKDLGTFFGTGAKEIPGVYFVVEKEFDVPDTSEGAAPGATVKAWKAVKADGTQASEDLSDALAGLTAVNAEKNYTALTLDTSKLPKGTYRINEIHEKSTYKGENGETLTDMKAVPTEITLPLVNDSGVVTEAHVYPKNIEEKPETNKDFTKEFENGKNGRTDQEKSDAAAEPHNVGDVIDYTVTTKVPAKTKWKTAFWDDKMTEGLTFIQRKDNADKGITVKYDGNVMDESWYELSETENGFTLKLTDKGLEEIAKATEVKEIRLDYHATVNEKAVVAIPESNDVSFHYGNHKDHGTTPVPNKPNDNGELTVTKDWDTGVAKKDVTFTLYNAQNGKVVKETDVEKVDGYEFKNPVTIKAGETMSYTWKGLNKNFEYKVEEEYNGYSAEYIKGEAGQITVKNYNDENPKPINPTEPKVVTYGAKFVKTDTEGKRLEGAEFVIRNNENKFLTGTAADRKAYNDAQEEFEDAVKAYNAAVKKGTISADNKVTIGTVEYEKEADAKAAIAKLEKTRDELWNATLKDMTQWGEKDNAIKLTSNELGQFEIAGLAPGKYTLVETKAPDTFVDATKATLEFEFEIKADGSQAVRNIDFGADDKDTTNDNAQQVINKKVSIPQTGGIGTVIFTAIGLAIMASAIIAIKKRQATEAR